MSQERSKTTGLNGAQVARDVMTRNLHTVTRDRSIRDVAEIMAREDTGVVPVVDGRTIIGLITDRDIVVRLVAEGKELSKTSIDQVMSATIRSVKEETPLTEVMQVMSKSQVRRVPVVNDQGQLVGIVSLADLATETTASGKVGETVGLISEGGSNN